MLNVFSPLTSPSLCFTWLQFAFRLLLRLLLQFPLCNISNNSYKRFRNMTFLLVQYRVSITEGPVQRRTKAIRQVDTRRFLVAKHDFL